MNGRRPRMLLLAGVTLSARQELRTERSPFFSDPFAREFFGRDRVEEAGTGA